MAIKLPAAPPLSEDFYTYALDYGALAAGVAGASQKIQAEANSWFVLYKMAQFSAVAGATQSSGTLIVPLCTITIQDTSAGWQWSNTPVPLGSIFGSAGLPFILPNPRVWAPNSSITIQITNVATGVNYSDITLSFIGKRLTYA